MTNKTIFPAGMSAGSLKLYKKLTCLTAIYRKNKEALLLSNP